MKKVRLKDTCGYKKMNTPYGLITHEWTEVEDYLPLYKEMEVFGEQKQPVEVEVKAEKVEVVVS